MRPLHVLRPLLSLLLVLCALAPARAASAQLAAVVVSGPPIAPLPEQPGTGLCSASSRSQSPASDFPQSQSTYVGGLNAFLEANRANRITSVLRTAVDLSNNVNDGRTLSHGDFTGSVTGCGIGGCDFAYSDTSTSFATRLRGFIAVTEAQVGKPLHFGFYADDSVSLTLFDRDAQPYQVVVRPPQLGFATWRTTNTVRFQQAGLYGVEVLYTQIADHAALEMSLLEGAFTDFERSASQVPIVNLRTENFALVTPEMFHQTESGGPSFPDLAQCAQCARQDANTPGNSSCGVASHCNAAALCAPCDSGAFCGDACSPCGVGTPYCVIQTLGFTCAQCRAALDCVAPDACHTAVCTESGTCSSAPVMNGTECPGGTCQEGTCEPVDAGTPDGGGADAGDAGVDGGGSEPGDDAGSLDGSVSDPDGGEPEPLDAGTTPDAGGGMGPGDAGPSGGDEGPESGCGCGSGTSALAPMALLGLALLLRRSRKHLARHP